jgi:hypothetical protein
MEFDDSTFPGVEGRDRSEASSKASTSIDIRALTMAQTCQPEPHNDEAPLSSRHPRKEPRIDGPLADIPCGSYRTHFCRGRRGEIRPLILLDLGGAILEGFCHPYDSHAYVVRDASLLIDYMVKRLCGEPDLLQPIARSMLACGTIC